MEFFRQNYWSGLPFPTPGDLPDPGIEPMSLEFTERRETEREEREREKEKERERERKRERERERERERRAALNSFKK